MKSIDTENLKDEHRDVFKNPAIDSLINLKRQGDRGMILQSNSNEYSEMSEAAYMQKFKEALPKLGKYLNRILK